MKEKECFKCLRVLPLDDFYKHPQMADGRLNKCKECTKKDTKANREARKEYYDEYDRQRNQIPERRDYIARNYRRLKAEDPERFKEYRRRYEQASTEKRKETLREYRQKNPLKTNARQAVRRAVLRGKLMRQPCQVCGATDKVQAHHHDYSKPLDVEWLCPKHHGEEHRQYA